MSGKGSKARKGANLTKFRNNYDSIIWKKRKAPVKRNAS